MPNVVNKPSECARCDYITDLEFYNGGEWLCDLCAGTHGGQFVSQDVRAVVRSMCYIGNAIIEAIKESKP